MFFISTWDASAPQGNKANLNSPALTGVPTINGSKISIIEPPTWYDLPLTDDVQTYHASTKTAYCKNYFGMVYITFYIKRTNSLDFPLGSNTIANLPTGCRPDKNVHAVASISLTGNTIYSQNSLVCFVTPNGNVNIHVPMAGVKAVTGTIVFYAQEN